MEGGSLRRSMRPRQQPDRLGYQQLGVPQESNVELPEAQGARRNLDQVFEELASTGRRQHSRNTPLELSRISQPQYYSTPSTASRNTLTRTAVTSKSNSQIEDDKQRAASDASWKMGSEGYVGDVIRKLEESNFLKEFQSSSQQLIELGTDNKKEFLENSHQSIKLGVDNKRINKKEFRYSSLQSIEQGEDDEEGSKFLDDEVDLDEYGSYESDSEPEREEAAEKKGFPHVNVETHYRPTPKPRSLWRPASPAKEDSRIRALANVEAWALQAPKTKPRVLYGPTADNKKADLGFQAPLPKPRHVSFVNRNDDRSSYEPAKKVDFHKKVPDPKPRRTWSRVTAPPVATVRTRTSPTPPPATGVESLASAIVQALQSQNQQTERFVARQSSSSALPIFTGNPLDWPLFAHHFRQSTEDCGFTQTQNMARLEKALKGEARRTVRSLMIVPTNTNAVMERLEQRYGRAEYVIGALVDIARKTPTPRENKLSSFIDFSNAIQNLVTTVETLQVPAYMENPQLLQELVDKLPDSFKIQWGMYRIRLGNRLPTLEQFADWIAQVAEATSMVTIPKYSWKDRKDKEESTFVAVDDKSDSSQSTRICAACKKDDHGLAGCEDFKKKTVTERWDFVKKNGVCFRCLRKGHAIKLCRSKATCRVDGCNRRHHTLLHGPPPSQAKSEPAVDKVKEKLEQLNGMMTMDRPRTAVLLRIIVVTLYGPQGAVKVNALLDGASSVTLIAIELAEQLGLHGALDPLRIKWTNGQAQNDTSSMKVDCFVGPVGEDLKYKLKGARTMTNLLLPRQRTDLKEIVGQYPHLQTVKMLTMPGERPLVIIGQPHAHLIVARDIIEKDEDSPIITKTKLGWVMHGPAAGEPGEEAAFLCHHESDDDILHNLVKETFALESIGIKTNVCTRSKEDIAAEEKMAQVTRRVDNGTRWETGLLWRKEPVELPNSRDVALHRLLGIERKLRKWPDLKEQYKLKIDHYIKSGYARKLSPEELQQRSPKEWYLPHFDTRHPNKPGKIRIVFDAASKAHGVSLNDYLLTGPDLLVSLPGILVKFRQRAIAIGGDIAEMFHQVGIRKEDCPAQRFLWRDNEEDEEPSTYQLEVMMFGSVCSPFCAQYVKNKNALEFEEEFPEAVKSITEKHYMDDWLQSLDSEGEAIQLALDVMEVHRKGGFEIGKWTSNSQKFLKTLGSGDGVASKDLAEWSEVPTERAVGLHWIPSEDKFTFRVNLERAGKGIATGEVVPTKRMVLRLVMLVWDPLGFLGHYLIKARILLQDLWKSKIGWDDQITAVQFKKWKSWVAKLPELSRIRISRCYSSAASKSPDVQLHLFADSSELASCSIVYLRVVEDDKVTVTMVMSKTRVAPVKPCSIPRLELTAALVASRLGKFLMAELDIVIHAVFYWTDSMTTLRWIRSNAKRYQQFVAARVGEIQENTEEQQWRWVPSQENPADDGTRDGKVDLGEDCRWWNGPSFLQLPPEEWPTEAEPSRPDAEEDMLETKKGFVAVMAEDLEFCLPDIARFSKYMRLVRATAFVLRIIDIWQKRELPRFLQISKSELLLCRRSQWEDYPTEMGLLTKGSSVPKNSSLFQLSPTLDDMGVLRLKSRLATAKDEGLRLPIILHPKNRLTCLLLEFYHQLHHHAGEDLVRNEVRQRFWIPNLRSSVRKVVRECLVCRKRKVKGETPMMAALPDVKIQPQPRPFYVCGMDYFGPLEVTIGRRREKRYGVLFTCMNTRAVHLEIAASLSTDSCIMAIRRMFARRGQSSQMFSDNGTNLRGAEKELRLALEELDPEKITGQLEAKGIQWTFIPPTASHMGGSWERLVRSVKTTMYIILKSRAPKEEVLQTIFAEAEATVNSRPLVDVPVDPESPEALTPFHFLIGTSSIATVPGDFDCKRVDLERQWRQGQALADSFWKRWMREYLPTLQRRAKWHNNYPSVQKGDVVVVLDESLRRNTWPLGLIINTFPGSDGIIRVAEVKTASGVYRRPVTKLGKLDIRAPVAEKRIDCHQSGGRMLPPEILDL